MSRQDEPTFVRAQTARRRARLGALATVIGMTGVLGLIATATHDPGYPSTIVTGKHHAPAEVTCTPTECITHPERWQFDILSGRRANTIDVDKTTYDRYNVGDADAG